MSEGNSKSRGGHRSKSASKSGSRSGRNSGSNSGSKGGGRSGGAAGSSGSGNGGRAGAIGRGDATADGVAREPGRDPVRAPHRVTPSLLVDSWYAAAIADGHRGDQGPPQRVASLDQTLETRFPRLSALARRWRWLRGVLWYLASRKMQRVVCLFASPGLLSFLFLESLFHDGQPRVVLVEFLRPRPAGAKARVKEALHARLCRWLFPGTIGAIQVMTDWEGQHYAAMYRLPARLFTTIPFPMMLNPSALPTLPAVPSAIVMASGRAACDWVTLFDAARNARWSLSVVCSQADRPQVERLNQDGRATVMSEVSPQEHARLLANAGVYALVLREQDASTGQVRLARAIEAGIPVVASDVRGLDGYLEAGITAIAVPPGDAAALRCAIDRLLADRQAYRELRTRAYEAMRSRSLEDYVSRIRLLALKDA